VVPNISCAAVPVLDVDGTPVAALSAMTIRSSLPSSAADLTVRAAREITRNLERIRRR
jgi:DNA-binding IclR family transcriptional regulator